MAGTLHSGHWTDSKRKHSNRPPLGNKNPNGRAVDRGKKRRNEEEEGGWEEEEEERGLSPHRSKWGSNGGREGRAPPSPLLFPSSSFLLFSSISCPGRPPDR